LVSECSQSVYETSCLGVSFGCLVGQDNAHNLFGLVELD
jgi:hypothetical protein